jgi:hypothetical protein
MFLHCRHFIVVCFTNESVTKLHVFFPKVQYYTWFENLLLNGAGITPMSLVRASDMLLLPTVGS